MSYSYYQNAAPGWGTNQFQFGAPPSPNFQPQPSWGGMDFYRAHAVNPDPSIYDHAWSNVRDYQNSSGGPGVGMHEARHWHRRAYGGLGELNKMDPDEIGHAAAYEAYRTWMHNSSMREPLSGDVERQREGLIGLAIAESTRLLQYSGRPVEHYTRVSASDAAAATASILFRHNRENSRDEYRSRSRLRHGSFSGLSHASSNDNHSDPYIYDNAVSYPRSRSRHRSHSRSSSHFPMMQPGGFVNSSLSGSIPIPASTIAVPTAGIGGNSYNSPYGSQGMGMQMQGSPYQPLSMPVGGSAYSSVPMVVPVGSSRHHNHSSGHNGLSRRSSFSSSYGLQPHMGSVGGMGFAGVNGIGMGMGAPMMMPQQQQPLVIVTSSRKSKHKHRKRSRSIDPMTYSQYTSSMRY